MNECVQMDKHDFNGEVASHRVFNGVLRLDIEQYISILAYQVPGASSEWQIQLLSIVD